MKITAHTPRRKTINIANDTFTLYNANAGDNGYSAPCHVRAYTEWSHAGLERRYGIGTRYKGLLVIDSTQGYVDDGESVPTGGFICRVGDKIVPYATDEPLDDLLKRKEKAFTVMDVSTFTNGGALLSVEVLCG